MAEELESLDQKAITEQYIASYHYTRGQKLVAIIAVILVICGFVGLGTMLFVNIIDVFIK
jgi:hypothetical protein